MPVEYRSDLDGVMPDHLHGFFVGWPNAPTPETHLRLLENSAHCVVARRAGSPAVIGYATALTDGVLSAYISHLEVLPAHRGHGVGSELVRRLLAELGEIYMIDLVCDPDVQPFYAALGLTAHHSMIRRNYAAQPGLPPGRGDDPPGTGHRRS